MRWFQSDAASMLHLLKPAFDAPVRPQAAPSETTPKLTYSGQRKSCEVCLSSKTRVLETRASADKTRRRHLCMDCGHKFSTYESVGRNTGKLARPAAASEHAIARPDRTASAVAEGAAVDVGCAPLVKAVLVAPVRGRRSPLNGRPLPRAMVSPSVAPSRDREPLGPSSAFDVGRVLAAQTLPR